MNNEMTPDTARALEVIRPLANELGINISADAYTLSCNGQRIGIGCNSTYATIIEFIGYLFGEVWMHDRDHYIGLDATKVDVHQAIKTYWVRK